MKVYFSLLLLCLAFGCTSKNSQKKSLSSISECSPKYDSLYFGMEPLSNDSSEFGFIDLRECSVGMEGDSLVIRINTRDFPDSIVYNNPFISLGYKEFALEVIFRNKSSKEKNNIVFSLVYDNFNKPRGARRGKFIDFLHDCDQNVYREKEATIKNGEMILNKDYPINKNIVDWAIDGSSYIISIPKDSVCHLLEDYFSHKFNVELCYNNPYEKSKNNYLSTELVSDTLMLHMFMWNSARQTTKKENL